MLFRASLLTFSEFTLRGSKFLLFLSLANLYSVEIIYEYSYFVALLSIISVFSDFGIQTYLSREFSIKQKSERVYLNISLIRVVLFIYISIPFLIYSLNEKLGVFLFLIFLSDTLFAMNFAYLRAYRRYIRESFIKFLVAICYLFASLAPLFRVEVETLFLSLSIALTLIGVLTFSKFKIEQFFKFLLLFKFKKYLYLIQARATYIFLSSLFTIIYLRVDILMLSWLDTPDSVATYTIASRVLELSLIIPAVISAILIPKFAKSKEINFKRELILQFLIGVLVMLLFLSISKYLITTLFPNYQNAVEILEIILISIPFMLLNNYLFSYFISKKKSHLYLISTSTMALLNIVLNLLTIPKYSYFGAIYSTLSTEIVGTFLAFYLFSKICYNFDKS